MLKTFSKNYVYSLGERASSESNSKNLTPNDKRELLPTGHCFQILPNWRGKKQQQGTVLQKIGGNVTQDGRIIQGGKSYFTREIPVKVTEQRNRAILKGI